MRRPDLDDLPPLPAGVERGTGSDADGLARLLDAAFAKEWTTDRVRRELLDEPDVRDTYLVRRGRLVVATASALVRADQPDVGILHWVASDPALRGRGLGLAVTLAVLHRFAADGLTASILHTDDDRLPAISAYLRLGYVPEYPDQRHQARWSRIFRRLSLRRRSQ